METLRKEIALTQCPFWVEGACTQIKVDLEELRKELRWEYTQQLERQDEETRRLIAEKERDMQKLEQALAEKIAEKNRDMQKLEQALQRANETIEAVQKTAEAQYKAKYEKKLNKMKEQIAECQNTIANMNARVKGALSETAFLKRLQKAFPQETWKLVKDRGDIEAKGILVEVKDRKTWKNGWIQKLEKDMRNRGAKVGVLVTSKVPKKLCTTSEVIVVSPDLALYGVQAALNYLELLEKTPNRENELRVKFKEVQELVCYMQKDIDARAAHQAALETILLRDRDRIASIMTILEQPLKI
nr:DUF2130 domain-containing protein [Candidatus Njordarchaeum guaymaensis]